MSNTVVTDNRKKKLIIGIVICGLVLIAGLALMIGGINAYLTETETVTNTFTVGEVTIDLIEPNYPGNGSDEVSDLVGLEEVPKDPQIKNTGKNRAIVFISVDIPMANIITADADGNRLPQQNTELFDYRTLDGEFDSYHDEHWVHLYTTYYGEDGEPVDEQDAVKVRRLYGYDIVLEENEVTLPIFDVVRLCNTIEGQIDNTTQEIVILGYGIQADNIAGVTDANWQETMDADKLKEVFEVYMNQSADVIPEDGDNSNYQTVTDTTLNLTMTIQNTHLKLNSGNPEDAKTMILFNVAYTGPNDAPVPIFESSNPDVATVDMYGQIEAVGVGSTVISMSAVNPDTGNTAIAKVTVRVRDMNSGETFTDTDDPDDENPGTADDPTVSENDQDTVYDTD